MEQKEKEKIIYDLEKKEDINRFGEEMNKGINYFVMDEDVTYKIQLTSPNVEQITKNFDGDNVIKYVFNIKAESNKGYKFEGQWEVGRTVAKDIYKHYHKDAIFKVTKSGTGMKTRYNVVKDF